MTTTAQSEILGPLLFTAYEKMVRRSASLTAYEKLVSSSLELLLEGSRMDFDPHHQAVQVLVAGAIDHPVVVTYQSDCASDALEAFGIRAVCSRVYQALAVFTDVPALGLDQITWITIAEKPERWDGKASGIPEIKQLSYSGLGFGAEDFQSEPLRQIDAAYVRVLSLSYDLMRSPIGSFPGWVDLLGKYFPSPVTAFPMLSPNGSAAIRPWLF